MPGVLGSPGGLDPEGGLGLLGLLDPGLGGLVPSFLDWPGGGMTPGRLGGTFGGPFPFLSFLVSFLLPPHPMATALSPSDLLVSASVSVFVRSDQIVCLRS